MTYRKFVDMNIFDEFIGFFFWHDEIILVVILVVLVVS